MQNIKDEIFNLKKELEAKEQQYAQQQQVRIYNLEKEIEQLNNASENRIEQIEKLESQRNELDKEINLLKDEFRKKEDEKDSILKNAKDSVHEFITSRKKIKEQNEKIEKLTLQNSNILTQQINISNLTVIQELSLIQLDIKIQEYKELKISEKEVYRGLFDVSFKQKIGVNLNDLTYELSNDKKTLSVYNVNTTISLDKTHQIVEIFSELRERQEKNIVGLGDNGWLIKDKGKDKGKGKELDCEKIIREEIREKIDNKFYIENNISIIEGSFNKAIEQYLRNITGNNFEIKINKTENPKAVSFGNCFNTYNEDLNNQIENISNTQKTIEDIEGKLIVDIANLDNKK